MLQVQRERQGQPSASATNGPPPPPPPPFPGFSEPFDQAAARLQPVRVGGNIRAPTKIKDVKPVYPPDAQSARVQGVVIIEAIIDEDGSVANARILRSIPMLDSAALSAVSQWKFTPTAAEWRAGWRDHDGDGELHPDGVVFERPCAGTCSRSWRPSPPSSRSARSNRRRSRRLPSRPRAAAADAAALAASRRPAAAAGQQPPVFRGGTNQVRVDVTVLDRKGEPLTDLTKEDFEVREDGIPQAIDTIKLIEATGEAPDDDTSLPIRSPHHAAAEAARDDIRVFVIFWDEYHIGEMAPAIRARAALTDFVQFAFGPTDLVALMDQLTPSDAIRFTRNRRELAEQVHKLKGRQGVYMPPRSAVEEAQMYRSRDIEMLRVAGDRRRRSSRRSRFSDRSRKGARRSCSSRRRSAASAPARATRSPGSTTPSGWPTRTTRRSTRSIRAAST